jgi:predicted lysophospholipase L1 biosynthesis ABC-type transport system permease subunit
MDGPGMRLMRLWLWTAPLAMLALAALFGWLAVDEGKWGLLVAMVLLALVAVGLFVIQWRLLEPYRRSTGPGGQDGEAN